MNNKKGLSPIVATVLLVVIAIALFVIIFLWIRSFQGESVSKFGAPIENACPNVYLQINVIGTSLQINNDGNVPVYKIQVFEFDGESTTHIDDFVIELSSGSTTQVDGISCSNQLKIVPVLLGINNEGAQREHVCDKEPIIVSC